MLNRDGSLLFPTVFGGARDDVGVAVAWHSNDSLIIAGYTESAEFPICGAYQETHAGDFDMFIMRIDLQGLIDVLSGGFTFGPLEGSIVVGAIAVVVLLLFVRKRAG